MHSRKDRLTFSCGGITSSGGACSDCQGLCMPEKMCNRGWPADVHSMQLSLSTERTRREILQLKPFSWIDPLTCWNSCSRVLHWSLKVRVGTPHTLMMQQSPLLTHSYTYRVNHSLTEACRSVTYTLTLNKINVRCLPPECP